jgi:hypothetical protein
MIGAPYFIFDTWSLNDNPNFEFPNLAKFQNVVGAPHVESKSEYFFRAGMQKSCSQKQA